MCLAFLRSQYTVTRLHHVSGVIIPKQYINSLSYHHSMNQLDESTLQQLAQFENSEQLL